MTLKDSVAKKEVSEEFDLFGEFTIEQKLDKRYGDEKLLMFKTGPNMYGYQRFHKEQLTIEKVIASDKTLKLGIFPVAPIHTPEKVGDYVMLKLITPLVLEPQSRVVAYLTMPIEIGVVRSDTGEVNMIDVFSVGLQYYAIYGTPENGLLCRYHLTRISAEMPKAAMYQEAVVKVHFMNNTRKVTTVNRVVFPVAGTNFYVRGTEAYYNDLDMVVSDRLSSTVAGVRFSSVKSGASSEWTLSEALLKQQFKFIMEWGL